MNLVKGLVTAVSLVALSSVAFADKAWEESQYFPGGKEYFSWNQVPGFVGLADVNESEPNGTPAEANAYTLGDVYHGFLTASDNDYVVFTANSGDVLVAATDADGSDTVDTLIDLIAADGTTIIETDDDDGPGTYSLITRTLTASGTYYLRVRPFTTATGNYKLTITATPPPPPPANDTCETATPIARCSMYTESGSTATANNDYSPTDTPLTGCTGFTELGRDVAYRLDLLAGDVVTVNYTNTTDGAIYIVTDCADEPNTCVAGADDTFSGQPETLVYAAAAPGAYYLIADSFSANSGGTFTLTVTIDCPVSVDPASWGQVKSLYR